jgi:hypothetical protein
MPLQPVRHLSIGISRPFTEAYDFLADPENFPKWASGLGHSFRHLNGMDWLAETPMGPLKVRFSERNGFGVLDHTVTSAEGAAMLNPMRVFPNGAGSEVVLSLIRRPEMSDEEVVRDAEWVLRDLQALKELLEK